MSEPAPVTVLPVREGPARAAVVALVGNPNSGKTTLFNALTGLRAKVGNYPGITVEHREGTLGGAAGGARLIDLPGTYSLVPRSDDEVVAVQGLLGRLPCGRPDLVIAVVDATNLERNLYLVAQLRELEVPLVVALTMMDTIEADGVVVDVPTLAKRIGVPVVACAAVQSGGARGLAALVAAAPRAVAPMGPMVGEGAELEALGRAVAESFPYRANPVSLALWAKALAAARTAGQLLPGEVVARIGEGGPTVEQVAGGRYQRVRGWLEGVVSRRSVGQTKSDRLTARLDAVALHPVLGPVLLLAVFGGLFELLFQGAEPIVEVIDGIMGDLGSAIGAVVPASMPLVQSLLVDGLVKGVGNVVVFVPQIALLFLFLGLLEDSGYLARAAFLLDRLMARVGLHGRAFVPMLSGLACAVPAVMATRTIESTKDRLVTILVTPLMSCSARLPVYGLMIGTVFATLPPIWGFIHPGAAAMIAMYVLSLVATLGMAAVFKRTILKSPAPPFVLELPPYRRPRLGDLLRHVWTRVRSFLMDAGTIILAITIVLWGLFNFPKSQEIPLRAEAGRAQVAATIADATAREEAIAAIDSTERREQLEFSIAGRLGHAIEPVLAPLGWDWKVGVGIIASFAAREVLVSTLGLVYGLGDGSDEESPPLREAMRRDRDPVTGKPIHTPLSGLSLMVFFVLAMQCMSTLAAVRRETRSWKWPAFQLGYMTVLAYGAALLVFQGGRALGLG